VIASLVLGPRGRRTKLEPQDEYAYLPPEHVSARAGDLGLISLGLQETRVIDLTEDRVRDN